MRNLTFLVLVGLAFAGCLGDDEPADDHADHGDHMDGEDHMDGMMDDNATSVNSPPVATLTANVTNATIPFDVLFDFSVEDVDGDSILWTFDADGDGTPETEGEWFADNGTYPASNFTFTYTTNGTFNATLTVDDLSNVTTATVSIDAVDAPADPASAPEFPDDPTCVTDVGATAVAGLLYATGAVWIYAEDNGKPGLQRNDSSWADTCEDPDLLIF